MASQLSSQVTQLYTVSRANAFQTCKRLHYYKFEARRRSRNVADALRFGHVYHRGLEQWLIAHQQGGTPMDCRKAMSFGVQTALDELDDRSELDPFSCARILELLAGYHARWIDWLQTVRVLAVEAEFCCELINPKTGFASRTFALAGKLDAIIEHEGKAWLMEHKTTGSDISPGADYWNRLRIDGQISTYYYGALSLGFDVAGCIYDVARKPRIRPLKATPVDDRRFTKGKGCKACGGSAGGRRGIERGTGKSPAGNEDCLECAGSGWVDEPRLHKGQRTDDETADAYQERVRDSIASDPEGTYHHGTVVRLPQELDEYAKDTWLTAKAIRESQNLNAWPRNPQACHSYNRFCEYWSVCTGCADIRDNNLYYDSLPHPELIMGQR